MRSYISVISATIAVALVGVGMTQSPSAQAPWVSADIGAPSAHGSAMTGGSTFTVNGGGKDIWGSTDQFQFVYQPMTGDTQIVAYIASFQSPVPYSKAGVMISRPSAAPRTEIAGVMTPSP